MQELKDIVESALFLKGHEVVSDTDTSLVIVCADGYKVRIDFTEL